jgi:arylsulfatase A-like enzyme
MHLQLPHAPYMLRPDGSIHPESPAGFDPEFAGNAELLSRLHADYEMQVEFVDRELGAFLAKLKQAGLYDSSLILVTSDHGVSWKPEAPGRVLTEENADMIFPVPLFLKLPGQTDGRLSREDVQLMDVLPTITAVVGVRVPWQVEGRNMLTPDQPPRQKIMVDGSGRRFIHDGNFAETVTGK